VRDGHGSGLVGTHERCIWHGRYGRACDQRLHGRLCLRLSRGLSGQGGREASKAPARGERRTGEAASQDEGLIRSCSRWNEGAHFGDKEMLLLVALSVMLVATAASALPAESHEWYAGLRSPSGMPCCNERDCRPVASPVNHDTRREEIQANGAWYPVEYGKVLPFPSPDGGYHAWGATRREDPTFAASSFPAWPLSPPRRVQLEPLLIYCSARGRRLRLTL